MKVCAVLSCRKDSSKFPGLAFFNLPRDPCARSEWLDALGLKRNEGTANVKVCENHFKAKDFCAGKRQLKIHAVPVLNLGVRKVEPLDSDDEFMHCDSDTDELLREVKKITAAEAMMDRKIKKEEPEEKPQEEQEQETGRRPSRRAAREAAKKIYNTVHNYGCTPDNDVTEAVTARSSKPLTQSPKTHNATPRPAQRQRRSYQPVKIPPPNIDLVMECHEELLSTVQAEALLQAQMQYNMVMKTLRNLRASNVHITQLPEEPRIILDSSDDEDMKESSNDKSAGEIVLEPTKKGVFPMKLTTSVPSPAPILS